jgi:hypothetical protein
VRLNGCVICSKNGVMTVSCTGCGFRDLTVESGGDAVRCRSRDIPRQQLTDPVDRCSRRERSPGVPGKHGNPIAGGATDNLDVAVRRLSQDWVKSQPARCVGTTAEAPQIADGIVASQRTGGLCQLQTSAIDRRAKFLARSGARFFQGNPLLGHGGLSGRHTCDLQHMTMKAWKIACVCWKSKTQTTEHK